jgi:hypothetical protein
VKLPFKKHSYSYSVNINHWSLSRSLTVGRVPASFLKILFRKFLEADDKCSGNSRGALHILEYNSLSFYPLNGNLPQSKAYSKTPKAHTSAGGPQYSILETISGAI